MKKVLSFVLIALLAMSLFAGGASESSAPQAAAKPAEAAPAKESKYGGTVHLAQEVFDYCVTIGTPFATTGQEQETAEKAIFDKLWVRGADGKIEMQLADSYTVSEDGLDYIFKLKQGIKFHDGSDFNADVVAWNWNKIKEFGFITNVAGAEAIDEYTVKISLTKPNPFFLMSNAARTPMYMCSKANYEKLGEASKTNPVGTGPFKFVSMEAGKSIKLEKNENYWRKDTDGSQLPYADAVEITVISDPTVAAAALANGEIDAYIGTLTDLKGNLETYDLSKFTIDTGKVPTKVSGIRFMANSRNAKLFTDERLRKAVAYAIDAKAVADMYPDGEFVYTNQIALPGGLDYIENPVTYDYNPEKAKELLKEAGYPNGFDIDINIDTSANSQMLAELYQYYLGEVGIKVKIMSYANAERNKIQDSDDVKSQLLVSGTSITGDSANVWNNCSPSRKKWNNMLPFETEPGWVELWNKVSACSKDIDAAYKALGEYFAYAHEHCTQYLFLHEYKDIKYFSNKVDLQIEKVGDRWVDSALIYFK